MENGKINVLFVCGFGMGTSTMAELGVKNNLNKLHIAANVQHTSLGQMESLREWADIIVILKNLFNQMQVKEGEFILPVVNVMDGKGIAAQIEEIVDKHFPQAKG